MLLFHLELAPHDAYTVRGDASVEAAAAFEIRHHIVEEALDCSQELVVGGAVLHQPASIRFRSSHSVSAVRRPMAASSIAGPALLTTPSRPVRPPPVALL